MAIDLQNSQNIATGWGAPPKFDAPNIGGMVGDILKVRLAQKVEQDKQIAEAVKAMQAQREDSAYTDALRNAGLTQGQDISGVGGKHATALAQLVAANTRDTDMDAYHQAMAAYYNRSPGAGMGGSGRGSGVPRYDYHGVLLTGAEYQKRIDQDKVAQTIGALSAQEADAQGKITGYQAKYGVDPESPTGLKGTPTPQDLQDYLKANADAARLKKQRENYKWFHHNVDQQSGSSGQTDDGEDGGDGDTANTSYAPPPPAAPQASPAQTGSPLPSRPIPTASPRPNRPPPADSAAGHVSTYGTPAPGGGAATGDLVAGQSRRNVGGKWYVWDGNQWQLE